MKQKISYVNHRSEIPAIKFLGVYFDPKLDCKYHISQINAKLSKGLFILRKSKNILSEEALKSLYYSLFHCHLTYGILVYTSVCKSSLQGLIKKQKAAIRILANTKYNLHTNPLFSRLKILPFESLIKYFSLQFFFDFRTHKLPRSFDNYWLTTGESNERYPLRNANEYVIPRYRTNKISLFPRWSLPRIWNEFDDSENIKSSLSRNVFNVKLKKFFIASTPLECLVENCPICQNLI